MKTFTAVALVASALANVAHSHYIFEYLTANGQQGAAYQNIRKNTNYNSPTSRHLTSAATSAVPAVAVAAGASVTFTANVAVYHQGPVSFYMTKVADATTADESSQWFKIREIGPTFSGGSATWDMESDYLVRIEQLAIHNPGATPPFYISCAQVKLTGGGSGSPSPTVAIPGHVKATDPGYTANIYNNFNSYTVPGPKVWAC